MSNSWTEVTLPSGLVASVRRLGLFELDLVEKNIPGPYTYTLQVLSGKSYEVPFDYSTVRIKPQTPLEEVKENTQEFYAWQEYLRYQEALTHHNKQMEAYGNYCERVKDFIISHCLKDILIENITVEDWDEIYRLVLNPFISIEEVSAVMRDTFRS